MKELKPCSECEKILAMGRLVPEFTEEQQRQRDIKELRHFFSALGCTGACYPLLERLEEEESYV